MTNIEYANLIIDALIDNNVGCYIYKEADSTTSVYIRFENPANGSIRIGDHDGVLNYRYKYNLRTDKHYHGKLGWRHDRGIFRYFATPKEIGFLIEEIIKRNERVKTWDSKYPYKEHITKFKKDNNE